MDEATVFQPQPQQVQPEFSNADKSFFSFKTILKLALGILVVIFASFLIFGFLLPNLGKNKKRKSNPFFLGSA